MPIYKEYREWFLRHTQVNTGTKIDQEVGFPLQYIITGKGNVFNRFLKGDFPTENVFKKLFESVAFKLNVEDTASQTAQGLVRIATDVEAEGRTDNGANTFENVVKPHQLPEVVVNDVLTDVVLATNTNNGLTVKTIRRIISAGKTAKQYVLSLFPGGIIQQVYTNGNTGVGNGSGIGSYILGTIVVPANSINAIKDEFIALFKGKYNENDSIVLHLVIDGNDIAQYTIVNVNPLNIELEVLGTYISANQFLVFVKLIKVDTVTNTSATELYTYTITANPTAPFNIEYTIETTVLGANQGVLLYNKLSVNKNI